MLGLKQVHHIAIIATDTAIFLVSRCKAKSIAKRATRGKGIWRLMGNM